MSGNRGIYRIKVEFLDEKREIWFMRSVVVGFDYCHQFKNSFEKVSTRFYHF